MQPKCISFQEIFPIKIYENLSCSISHQSDDTLFRYKVQEIMLQSSDFLQRLLCLGDFRCTYVDRIPMNKKVIYLNQHVPHLLDVSIWSQKRQMLTGSFECRCDYIYCIILLYLLHYYYIYCIISIAFECRCDYIYCTRYWSYPVVFGQLLVRNPGDG